MFIILFVLLIQFYFLMNDNCNNSCSYYAFSAFSIQESIILQRSFSYLFDLGYIYKMSVYSMTLNSAAHTHTH